MAMTIAMCCLNTVKFMFDCDTLSNDMWLRRASWYADDAISGTAVSYWDAETPLYCFIRKPYDGLKWGFVQCVNGPPNATPMTDLRVGTWRVLSLARGVWEFHWLYRHCSRHWPYRNNPSCFWFKALFENITDQSRTLHFSYICSPSNPVLSDARVAV